jgi:hypothetical protein
LPEKRRVPTDLEPILCTAASYNASVVKIYNATGSLVCFEKKSLPWKNALAYFNAGDVAVNSKAVGLPPELQNSA